MVEGGNGAGFALETFGEGLTGGFDGDDAVEPGVARLIDFAHPARAELSEDFEGAEARTWRERHR